ncbi:MAG: PAS domain-containing sensor histidine kinase [Proteobacteria bacterium]|nr:PAS domain-containing sensor histidine kinase [Pseudomonadota bacterium]
MALLLIFAAIAGGAATYGALRAAPPFGNDPDTVIWLLNIDLIILLGLVTLVARRFVSLWAGRRRGLAGSRLQVRMVFIFSILTAAPAVIMTIFAAFFLHFGVQSWFSDRIKTAVGESQAVAEAYLEEHMQVMRADALAMANDIDRQASLLITSPETFGRVMQTQSILRNLSEAMVFEQDGTVLARTGLTLSLAFESIPAYIMDRAKNGDVALMTGVGEDRVRALVKLNNFAGSYLFVGRMVDPVVLSHVADTRRAVQEYETLQSQYGGLQVKITLIFVVVALLLLFAAIWAGLVFARRLASPIGSLILATERVRGGDMTARVEEFGSRDEFDVLGRAFNRMTMQIEEQRDELVTANRQLDRRRRFTEAVLAGVTSGILGVNKAGNITLANLSAGELLGEDIENLAGKDIGQIMPELGRLLDRALQKPGKITQGEIPFIDSDGIRRAFLVRIAVEPAGGEDAGSVITFDDITALQSAQRKAAWADVARRIAHEIKNPLTPIQLSAERLKRRYLSQIKEDRDTFSRCTDTIIHHVGDIGRMVNEFSAFARMPEPIIRKDDLFAVISEISSFQQQAHPDLKINIQLQGGSEDLAHIGFDAQQMRQVLNNIFQNAIDAIEGESGATEKHIEIFAGKREGEDEIFVAVTDSGPGFPGPDVSRLTDPYVTHKEKGTGLGLAIVKKIMEDHGGKLILGAPEWLKESGKWRDAGGASVVLILPSDAVAEEQRQQPLREAS